MYKQEANLQANSIDSVDCPDNKLTGGILGDFNESWGYFPYWKGLSSK